MAFNAGRPCRNSKCPGIARSSSPYCPPCAVEMSQIVASNKAKYAENNKQNSNSIDLNKKIDPSKDNGALGSDGKGALVPGTPKRPSAYRRGYDTKWRKLSKWFLQHNPWCVVCGNPADHTDHILPLSKGGSNELKNLQALCHRCHSKKTIKEFDGPSGHTQGGRGGLNPYGNY